MACDLLIDPNCGGGGYPPPPPGTTPPLQLPPIVILGSAPPGATYYVGPFEPGPPVAPFPVGLPPLGLLTPIPQAPPRTTRPGRGPKPSQVGLAALEAAIPLAAIGGPLAETGGAITGEELLASLLDATFGGGRGAVQTELEQLITRGPQTELERLLQKPMTPPAGTIAEAAAEAAGEKSLGRLILGMLGTVGEAIGLALYSPDAGISAAEEAARVAAGLQPPAPTAGGAGDTGLPSTPEPLPLLIPPVEPLPEVIVTAPPVSAPVVVPAPLTFPVGVPALGLLPLPAPATAPYPKPAPKPFALPLANPLGQPLGFGSPQLNPKPRPKPAPKPTFNTQPQTQALQQPCDCKKQGKSKKKKKPRDKCYRGTYTEGPMTLHKRRKEEIPCR